MLSTLISLFLAVLPASVQAYSNPGSCTGHCWAHDPSLIQRSSDGVYFLFNTGGAIGISKASSLAGPWTYEGNAIASGKSSIDLTGNTDLWAPDVQKYAVSTFGTQVSAIGYATSTTLEAGSWTDHGSLGVASKAGSAYNAIDPNLVLVGSTYYLTFGSFWNDIYQVKLANPPTKTTGTASYQVAYDTSGDHPAEGSFVYYYGGYYYLLWSQGICCGYATYV
ncbi:hypothetical protein HK100_004943 [Physocladia obscura]|uniref:Endo-1,5-alpha-L-arabinanase A n=1 Tax=Physocladia obscura TaxID=109957 RepID=A0AAD5ST80_9FUNG|nr:hypothetical protein HK100_004943 [Physocladia obscura]